MKLSAIQSYTGYLPAYNPNQNSATDKAGQYLQSIIFNTSNKIVDGKSLIKGTAEGKIVGGNLSVLSYLCGTKYFPSLKDKILLIEDVGEKTYKLDLLLNQIKQQKDFDKLKGIIIGQFTDCKVASSSDGTVEDCIKDFTAGLKIPTIYNLNYGHVKHSLILPLGVKVKMISSTKACSISW